MRALWPHGDAKVPGLVAGIIISAPTAFPRHGLTTKTAVCQAMAQFSHECGAGTEMTENTNYSAERAAQVWPLLGAKDKNAYRHFADASDCYRKCTSYPGDPDFHRKLINLVYGDRNGNRAGTNDGWNFVGRGLPQLTGRANYQRCGEKLGIDLVNNPDLACNPAKALEIGCADFVLCGCLPYALRGDTVEVTRLLNGGTVGLSQREQWLSRWTAALADQPEMMFAGPPAPAPRPEPQPAPLDRSAPSRPDPSPPLSPTAKHAGSATTGAAAGYAAHSAGLSPWICVAIGAAVAVAAFLIIHSATKRS